MMLDAVRLDPNYSLAKAAAARVVMVRTLQSWADENDISLGVSLAREALTDSRDDAMTLRNAGHSLAFLAREFELGVATLNRAVALNPNSAQVLASSGMVHNYVSQTDAAVEHFSRAIRLSPVDPEMAHFLAGLGFAYAIRGDHHNALHQALSAMHLLPGYAFPYRIAIISLIGQGRTDEARQMGERLLVISPKFSAAKFPLPPRDQTLADLWRDAFREAGLPE